MDESIWGWNSAQMWLYNNWSSCVSMGKKSPPHYNTALLARRPPVSLFGSVAVVLLANNVFCEAPLEPVSIVITMPYAAPAATFVVGPRTNFNFACQH